VYVSGILELWGIRSCWLLLSLCVGCSSSSLCLYLALFLCFILHLRYTQKLAVTLIYKVDLLIYARICRIDSIELENLLFLCIWRLLSWFGLYVYKLIENYMNLGCLQNGYIELAHLCTLSHSSKFSIVHI